MRRPPKAKIVGSNPAGHTKKKNNMMKFIFSIFALLSVCACNSVYMQPNSLDKNEVFFADSGGELMRLKTKEYMTNQGYNLTIGHFRASISTTYITAEGTESIISNTDIAKARYIVLIKETKNKLRPIWCSLNGFWWSDFNMSIADNVTGKELLHWSGHGCINSSVKKLEQILDKMEIK